MSNPPSESDPAGPATPGDPYQPASQPPPTTPAQPQQPSAQVPPPQQPYVPPQQPGPGATPPGPAPHPGYGQPAWSEPAAEGGGLKAAVDLSFGTYATPSIVKVLYILGVVIGVLAYLGMVISGFAAGRGVMYIGGSRGPYSAVPGMLALLFGWIPVVFYLLLLRVGLETSLAMVRAATDLRVMRGR